MFKETNSLKTPYQKCVNCPLVEEALSQSMKIPRAIYAQELHLVCKADIDTAVLGYVLAVDPIYVEVEFVPENHLFDNHRIIRGAPPDFCPQLPDTVKE